MIESLPEQKRRYLALSILVFVITLFMLVVVLPIVQMLDGYDTAIEDNLFRLSKLQRTAQLTTPLREQLKQLEAVADKSHDLLSGNSASLAGASLQETAKDTLRSTGIRLESSQMLPSTEEKGLQRIGIRIQFSASITALQKALYAFENNRPLLFVESFLIKSSTTARSSRNQRNATSSALQVSLDLFGYRHVEGSQ